MKFLFTKKQLFDYYALILISFLSGGCVDEVVDSQSNRQLYRFDVYFLQCHTFAVITLNGEGVC